jgi:hypothetical protein
MNILKESKTGIVAYMEAGKYGKFENLSTGNGRAFFDNVAYDVHWTVMGTHPLAGVYKSKENFLKNTFERLNKVLKWGVIMKIDHTHMFRATFLW